MFLEDIPGVHMIWVIGDGRVGRVFYSSKNFQQFKQCAACFHRDSGAT